MQSLYSVMIVEKQEQMIHVIKNMLPWKEYGFQIASVTDNEDQALAYYGEYRYGLVFTAIDLKKGNGYSLIRQIKHLNPHSYIVVISKHEDYDTVRDAFKAGCNDYLLKSRLRYSTLASLLQTVKQVLDNDINVNHQEEPWEYELEKLLGLMRDKQKVNLSRITTILQRKELSILKQSYRILYFRMDNVRIFNRNMKQYDKPSWLSTDEFIRMFQNKLALRDEMQLKLKQMIEEMFVDIPQMCLIFTKKHSGLILLPEMEVSMLIDKANELKQRILAVLTYEFSITISLSIEGVDSFLPMYEQMLSYHEHKFYAGDHSICNMEDRKTFSHLDEKAVSFIERITQALDIQRYDDVLPISKQAIQYMKQIEVEPKEVKAYFCKMIDYIEAMLAVKCQTQLYPFDVLRQGINETESIMYLDLELEKILKTLIDWMKEHLISKYKKKIVLIMQYIEEHMDQKVTLEMIANEIGLSEIHTSRIFKKETGKNLVAYINEEKMKKAASLLENDTIKIKEVAHKVGIEDQLYFNKVFRKHYQMSPREYRKKQ